MMKRGENSDFIPDDLVLEIFSRLPAKSVARFRCVSKLWSCMLHRPYFTKLFLTGSRARPRLLLALAQAGEWCFLTSPQPQNPYEKSSSPLVVAADFHMKFPGYIRPYFLGLESGLTCFRHHVRFPDEYEATTELVMCNPSTGQCESLPSNWIWNMERSCSYLGFDPFDKQYKVLSILERYPPKILTLGTGKVSWREIHCPLNHRPIPEGVCINGVLYYLAIKYPIHAQHVVIVCFDVRSEKFRFIDRKKFFSKTPVTTKLINYKGKLAGIWLHGARRRTGLFMWVIENIEQPEEWPEYIRCSWKRKAVGSDASVSVAGVTAAGEIVLSTDYTRNSFYVFYCNPVRRTFRRVEIHGFGSIENPSRVKSVCRPCRGSQFVKM